MILLRDSAAENEEDVLGALFAEQGCDAGNDDVVSAREDGESDAVDVFLDGGGDDHLWRLAEASVDDFHAGIAKGPGNDLGPAVVAIEARLRYEDSDWRIRHAV